MQRAGCEQSDISSVHTHNDHITNADVCKVDCNFCSWIRGQSNLVLSYEYPNNGTKIGWPFWSIPPTLTSLTIDYSL